MGRSVSAPIERLRWAFAEAKAGMRRREFLGVYGSAAAATYDVHVFTNARLASQVDALECRIFSKSDIETVGILRLRHEAANLLVFLQGNQSDHYGLSRILQKSGRLP
jgi:hypothetical protein